MDRTALLSITYGLYLVTSRLGDRLNGQISNTVVQISSEPVTVALSVNRQNLTHEFLRESKILAAMILSKETPLDFVGHFGFKSGRDVDKLQSVPFRPGETGAPIVPEHAVGYLEAEILQSLDAATHTIYVARVVEAQMLAGGEPMTYAYYRMMKRGRTPKTAPTYLPETGAPRVGALQGGAPEMTAGKELRASAFRCSICGYVYDPAKGDPDSGVAPGTPFEQLPDDWVCPVCGAAKSDFVKEG